MLGLSNVKAKLSDPTCRATVASTKWVDPIAAAALAVTAESDTHRVLSQALSPTDASGLVEWIASPLPNTVTRAEESTAALRALLSLT
jgi:hypothetical protein